MFIYFYLILSFFKIINGMVHYCQMTNVKIGCHTKVIQGMSVSCDGNNKIDIMPAITNLDPKYLVLSNFNFTRLQMFNFTKFKSVECMSIVDATKLTKIDIDAFSQMKELTDLTITNTNISNLNFLHTTHKLESIVINNNKNLENIDIYGERKNNLESLHYVKLQENNIDHVSSEFIRSIEKVKLFDLSKNKLKNLDFDMIASDQDQLSKLRLNGNLFQNINSSSLVLFQRLKELKLGNNPFHCNCNLKWLKNIYKRKDIIEDYEQMKCVSPNQKQLRDEKYFSCTEPGKPNIKIDLVQDGYHVNCSSYGDPAPSIELIMFNGQKVVVPPSEDLSITTTITPYVYSTIGGKFKCTAVNSKGRSHASLDVAQLLSGGTTIKGSLLSLVILLASILLI